MENVNQQQVKFTEEKLGKCIQNLNNLINEIELTNKENKNPTKEQGQKLNKLMNYVNSYLDHSSKLKSEETVSVLLKFLDLSETYYTNHSDELIEKLWNLYEKQNYSLLNLDNSKKAFDFFINMYFLSSKNVKMLTEFNILQFEKYKIKTNANELKNHLDTFKFENIEEKKNFLIDFILMNIFTHLDIKNFYTSLSSFIISTKNSVFLFFKTISLFAISLCQLDNRENFIGSLLFILGGVLLSHGKSYLKTKGLQPVDITGAVCSKHDSHSYFNAEIISTLECDFLESYLLLSLTQFISISVENVEFKQKWDSFIPIFYKYQVYKDLDVEESFPSEVLTESYILLFLNRFIESFVLNFTQGFGAEGNIITNFYYFDEFMHFVNSLFKQFYKSFEQVFTFISKNQASEFDCEKTEYFVKDVPNVKGFSLLILYNFSKDRLGDIIPLVYDENYITNVLLYSVNLFLKESILINSSLGKFFSNIVIKVFTLRKIDRNDKITFEILKLMLKSENQEMVDLVKNLLENVKFF